jgi:hypothetical protein
MVLSIAVLIVIYLIAPWVRHLAMVDWGGIGGIEKAAHLAVLRRCAGHRCEEESSSKFPDMWA